MNIILALLISTANAGWWADFCERHLVAEDPYQYETVSDKWLAEEIIRYEIRDRWGKLNNQEKTHLRIILREMDRRRI